MTTLDVEIVMMNYVNIRQNIIVPNVRWGLFLGGKYMHECDLFCLSKSGYATEIEIKTSKADLLKDKQKKHGHYHKHIKRLWFAVPEKLKETALQEIPERAGLYLLRKQDNGSISVRIEKHATARKDAIKWTDEERSDLMRLGAMRILTLKKQLQKEINKHIVRAGLCT